MQGQRSTHALTHRSLSRSLAVGMGCEWNGMGSIALRTCVCTSIYSTAQHSAVSV